MNTASRARILLIEDEAKTARAVLNGLKAEGFAPAWAETGEDGFFLLNSEHFDAVVLDWMLPGRSGLEVLKTVRAKDSKTPVLLLTARDALEDRVAGLDSGADDYLVKPFALAELAARLRALLRRATADSSAEEKPTHLLAEEKNQQIEITAEQLTIRADRELLRLALLNLVHNAIRYSAEWLMISLRVRRQEANAVVEVIDQGPGIAPNTGRKFLSGFTGSIRRDRVLVEVQVSAWPSRAGPLNGKGACRTGK